MTWRQFTAPLLAATALAAGASPARAADADATAVAVAPDDSGVYAGGSAQFAGDIRTGVVARWNADERRAEWLQRVDAAPGAADGFTAIVPSGDFVYGVGYAGTDLAVAKMDAATGVLRRACGAGGVNLSSLGAPVVPGRAVASGGDLIVVGGTLETPTRGFIARIDGSDCELRRSALVAGSANIGFTSVDIEPSGNPIVSGFAGAKPAVYRFDATLATRGSRTFDAGPVVSAAFTDVAVAGDRGVAVGVVGPRLLAQCFTVPALSPAESCGTGGQRSLAFHPAGFPTGTAALGRLPSGSWLVAGSHSGTAGFPAAQVRPALGAYAAADLAADVDGFPRVFDPFRAAPSSFGDVAASGSLIAAAGTSGFLGARRGFLFTSASDGKNPRFVPLAFDTAQPAPVELAPAAPAPSPPAPPTPPTTAGAPASAAPRLALASFGRVFRRPARDGTFGYLRLTCRWACTAQGRYTARVRATRTVRVGGTQARLAPNWGLRLRLALSRRGRRALSRAGRLNVMVAFVITGTGAERQFVRRTLTLRARRTR